MIEKQITLEKLIKNTDEAKCVSCNERLKEICWILPICRKCMKEAKEDLDE